jgi:cysteinyl-tRNA synthetase
MSSKYLGIKIDIHAGGMDLIFPHHENERAQSECAFGVSPWVKYWLHSGMVTIRGEKMSKSLGNIVLLKELLSKYKPETLRLWYLSAHYRAPIDFNEEIIAQYDKIRERLNDSFDQALKIVDAYRVEHSLDDGQLSLLRDLWESIRGYYLSLDNDFDTPNALKFVHEATSIFWKSVYTKESYAIALSYVLFMERVNRVFRFRIADKEKVSKLDEELIKVILDIRKKLREQKQYQLADEIRDKLKNLGIMIYDKGLESDFKLSR